MTNIENMKNMEKYIEKLYKFFIKDIDVFVNTKYSIKKIDDEKIKDKIKFKLNDNIFVSNIIKSKVSADFNEMYYVEIENNYVWFITDKNKIDKKTVDIVIKRILHIKKVYSIDASTKPLYIYIWLTDFKKTLPKKGEIIGADNANGGYNEGNTILIWRKEELPKVLIHELLHSFNCQLQLFNKISSNNNSNSNKNYIKKKFNIKGSFSVDESYVETLATIYNCVYCCIENGKILPLDYLLTFLNNERIFSVRQVNKILNHYNIHNLRELDIEYGNGNIVFKQDTNIFSYYIIKMLLLNNMDEFMKFMDKNICKYDIKKYNKLIIDSYKKYDIVYNNNGNNKMDRGLRMTITESNIL